MNEEDKKPRGTTTSLKGWTEEQKKARLREQKGRWVAEKRASKRDTPARAKAPPTDLKSLDEDELLEHNRRIRHKADKKRKNMNSEDGRLPNQPATPNQPPATPNRGVAEMHHRYATPQPHPHWPFCTISTGSQLTPI
jgi:hypothetical protein